MGVCTKSHRRLFFYCYNLKIITVLVEKWIITYHQATARRIICTEIHRWCFREIMNTTCMVRVVLVVDPCRHRPATKKPSPATKTCRPPSRRCWRTRSTVFGNWATLAKSRESIKRTSTNLWPSTKDGSTKWWPTKTYPRKPRTRTGRKRRRRRRRKDTSQRMRTKTNRRKTAKTLKRKSNTKIKIRSIVSLPRSLMLSKLSMRKQPKRKRKKKPRRRNSSEC